MASIIEYNSDRFYANKENYITEIFPDVIDIKDSDYHFFSFSFEKSLRFFLT